MSDQSITPPSEGRLSDKKDTHHLEEETEGTVPMTAKLFYQSGY